MTQRKRQNRLSPALYARLVQSHGKETVKGWIAAAKRRRAKNMDAYVAKCASNAKSEVSHRPVGIEAIRRKQNAYNVKTGKARWGNPRRRVL